DFVQWTGLPVYRDNPYVLIVEKSYDVGAVFSSIHVVVVKTDRTATFEYTLTMTDPSTGDEFIFEQGTFTLTPEDPGYELFIPSLTSLSVVVISDYSGYKVEWDDGNELTRQFGDTYSRTIRATDPERTEMTAIFISLSDPMLLLYISLIAIFLALALLIMLFLFAKRRPRVIGTVSRNDAGIAGVVMAFKLTEKPAEEGKPGNVREGTAKTNSKGNYTIIVTKGATLEISSAALEGAEVTSEVPIEITIDQRVIEKNFNADL
ncbi:MAG: hypothetical protein LBH69_03385, partial [Methanomassiliicoccaceae archaeon]|nr:hypothetical protein [Methanomassiliicoccaceae archaeon]